MNSPELSLLTDPMPIGRDFIPEYLRRFARAIKYRIVKRHCTSHSRYRGHSAVTRSLVEGMQKNGVRFSYNPAHLSDLARIVVVLAGVRTLRQAIQLKREGRIGKLCAGPNIVIFSTDVDSILAAPEVDLVITPSDWVKKHYIADAPSLRERIVAWPSGVDSSYWSPDSKLTRDKILVFDKRTASDDPERTRPYVNYLKQIGCKVVTITRTTDKRFGYTIDEYRSLLQSACLMIGFTVGSESQGIAWAEAWSTDVPTLISENQRYEFNSRMLDVSTAPYLNESNGLFFKDFNHFKQQFEFWNLNRQSFTPRSWVMQNMTDMVSAHLLYQKVMSC